MDLAAVSNGDVIVMAVAVASILAAVTFVAGSRRAFEEIGKPIFVMDSDLTAGDERTEKVTKAEREAEIRQMVEAKAFRRRERGEAEIDVEAELERMLTSAEPPPPGTDPELVEEVRQLVEARNARREARGEEPLDVDAEVSRRLSELENLGQ